MTTVSHADFINRLLGGVTAACLVAALAAPAWAQQSPPDQTEDPALDIRADKDRLYVDGKMRPLTTPTPIAPGPYVSAGSVKVEDRERLLAPEVDESENDPATAQPLDDIETPPAFEMGALEDIDPGAFGLLDESTGGLPVDLWRATTRENLTRLMAALPTATRSPEVNTMARLLLVSSFDIPPVEVGGDAGDYIRLRARKLAESGHLPDLVAFLDAMPDVANDASLLKLRAEAALLSGDNLVACRLIEQGRALEGATYWVKLDTYCAALRGDEAVVTFNMTLLEETADADDAFVGLTDDVLVRATGGGVVDAPSFDEAGRFDVLSYALYVASGRPLPINRIKEASPLVISAAAMRGDIDDARRLELATAATRRGLFLTDDLVGLALSLPFSDGELSMAALLADDPADARTDALLLQAGLAADSAYNKANMLNLAWSRARTMGDELVLAPGFHRVAKGIVPERDVLFFAPDAARIALSAGDFEGAMGWYELAVAAAIEGDLEGTRVLMGLWPFVLIADEENATPYSPEVLELWRQGLNVLEEDEARSRAEYLYSIIEVFGHDVPQYMWDALNPAPLEDESLEPLGEMVIDAPDAEIEDVLEDDTLMQFAEADVLRGEMLALGLSAFGEDGPRGLDGKTLAAALTSIKKAGYEDVARRLAVEALIGRGY